MDFLKDVNDFISFFDLAYVIITIMSLIKCFKKGFVLSILSASKWILAYVLTLFLCPKLRPYIDDFLDNNYILDILLGISIFVIMVFVILLINKSLNKSIKYSGLGGLDRVFGFFFGFVRSYIIAVCIFTTVDIVYNYERWAINVDKSFTFVWVEKGSNYLIKEFPTQKEQEDAKEKIKDI